MTKNNEVKSTINSMLDYYRSNNCFTPESIDELMFLADFADDEVGKLINKFHYINTNITDSGGVPVLKQVLEMVSGASNDNLAAATCDSNNTKANLWVWTEFAESLKPDRKAGEPVPVGYLLEGHSEYYPYHTWVQRGYVIRIGKQKEESTC